MKDENGVRISQIWISSTGTDALKNSKRVLAFTEHGLTMLSGVLRSSRAIQVNIAIVRAFVQLRHAVLSNRDVLRRVEKLEGKVDVHETDIRLLIQDVEIIKTRPGSDGPITPFVV